MFPDVSKDSNASIFKGCSSWTPQPLNIEALRPFETSGNSNPATQRHIPEQPSPQHCCGQRQSSFMHFLTASVKGLKPRRHLFSVCIYMTTLYSALVYTACTICFDEKISAFCPQNRHICVLHDLYSKKGKGRPIICYESTEGE